MENIDILIVRIYSCKVGEQSIQISFDKLLVPAEKCKKYLISE